MGKYDKKKFYWLQLKEDFFDEDSISWLEEQKNGKEYSLFYLKLCLKSLKTNGILIRSIGDILVPYTNEKLAEITKTYIDTVIIAMNLLQKLGLIKVLNNGEIYLSEVANMIGSKSIGAFRKEQQRLITINESDNIKKLSRGQEVDICPPDENIDIDTNNEDERTKSGHLSTKYRYRYRYRYRR